MTSSHRISVINFKTTLHFPTGISLKVSLIIIDPLNINNSKETHTSPIRLAESKLEWTVCQGLYIYIYIYLFIYLFAATYYATRV